MQGQILRKLSEVLQVLKDQLEEEREEPKADMIEVDGHYSLFQEDMVWVKNIRLVRLYLLLTFEIFFICFFELRNHIFKSAFRFKLKLLIQQTFVLRI